MQTVIEDRSVLGAIIRWGKVALYHFLLRSDDRYLLVKSTIVLWVARLGGYERAIYTQIPGVLSEGAVVIDVGANCGIYTRRFLEVVGDRGQVHAFEPNPAYHGILGRSTTTSGSLVLHREAVSDREGQLFLSIPRLRAGVPEPSLATVVAKATHDSVGVKVVTLDSMLSNLTRVDLIKIDVEGTELSVLRGALETIRRFRPYLIVESLDLPSLVILFDEIEVQYECHVGSRWAPLSSALVRANATYLLRCGL